MIPTIPTYTLNLSRLDMRGQPKQEHRDIAHEYIAYLQIGESPVLKELVQKLRQACKVKNGLLPSVGKGDYAIGHTIENAVGKRPDASRQPDYKGIEIKSSASRARQRDQLLSIQPSWEHERIRNGKDLVRWFPTRRHGSRYVHHSTVRTTAKSPQGLRLELTDENLLLLGPRKWGTIACWKLSDVRNALQRKHNRTLWVRAEERMVRGKRFYRPLAAEFTRGPIPGEFERLLAAGHVTVDLLPAKHTYSFKVSRARREELFGKPQPIRLLGR